MKNKNSKQELLDILGLCISNADIKKNKNKIINNLVYRIKISKTIDIINNNMPLVLLKNSELYFLLDEINRLNREIKVDKLKDLELEPTHYFTDLEIGDFEVIPLLEEDVDCEELILDDCYQVSENQWCIPKIEKSKILDLFYKNFVIYDYSVQRESEKVKYHGEEFERPKIYKKSVKSMTNEMIQGTYTPTAISINILKKDDNSFVYDDEHNRIYISKNDRNSLIDGMHRVCSLMEVSVLEPNVNQIMQLNIFNFDLSQARKYIHQEAQKNAISKELLRKYDNNNVYNIVAVDVEKEGNAMNNNLYNRIGNEKADLEIGNKYTTFAKLSEAIEDNFTIDTGDIKNRRRVKNFLVSFFNEIMSDYMKSTINIDFNKYREKNFALHSNSVYLYLRIAKNIYGLDNWEEILEEVISKIDFSYESMLATESKITNYSLNKKQKACIYKYIDTLMQI